MTTFFQRCCPLIFFLAIYFYTSVSAQQAEYSDSVVERQILFAKKHYESKVGKSSRIHLGKAYENYYYMNGGNPFTEEKHSNGEVYYDGLLYDELTLLLDIYKDILVFKPQGSIYSLMLDKTKVQWFALDARKFINIQTDSLGIPLGYYETLFSGEKTLFLAKRAKKLVVSNSYQTENEFVENHQLYLCIDGKCQLIRSKGGLLNALQTHKKPIKIFMKKQNIVFRNNLENAALQVVKFYDRL